MAGNVYPVSSTADAYRLLIADVHELAGLSRRLSGRDAAAHGATVGQWHVLSVISDTPATVPAIAARLGVTRQGAQRVVNELLAVGRVAAEPNPSHAQSPLITATPAGRKLLDVLWQATRTPRERVVAEAGVDIHALEHARKTIARLRDALRLQEG
jgi:DNA-binding MarR family transcriptional regulator